MGLTLPNYVFYGNPSADSVRFIRTDDSAMHRKDITVSRKPSVYNAATDVASIPEYRIAIRKDAQVGEPARPNGQRLTFDLTVRMPLQPSAADAEEAKTELINFLSQEGVIADMTSQLFPCQACDTDVAP